MKLFFRFFVITAAIAVSVTSCQKEFTNDDGLNPPVDSTNTPIADSIYIDKMYYVQENGTVTDTLAALIFNYDNFKRVINISDVGGTVYLQYGYNGSDSVPSLKKEYDDEDSTITYFTLDNQQRVIRDSSVTFLHAGGGQFFYYTIQQYTYAAGQLYGENKLVYNDPSMETVYTRDTAIVNAAGDIISNKLYRFDGAAYTQVGNAQFTYDQNNIGLYQRSSILKANYGFPNLDTVIPWEFMTHKNLLTQTEESIDPGNPFTFTNNFSYLYYPNGLTKKVTSVYHYGQTDVIYIGYRSL